MNWIERRIVFEQGIQGAWERLRVDLEATVKSFDSSYAFPQRAEMKVYVSNGCLHIEYAPLDPNKPDAPRRRSMDVCLDTKRHRMFARDESGEKCSIDFGFGADGAPVLIQRDANEPIMTHDKASQILLEWFLFPGGCLPEHIRFPLQIGPLRAA